MTQMSEEEKILGSLVKHMLKTETDPLTPLLDTYYLKRQTSKHRLESFQVDLKERIRPGGRLSPSSLCGCERQAAFVFVGMPGKKVIDPDQEAIWDDGKWRHHKWDATFLDMELVLGKKTFSVISIEEDVEIPELFIAGTLDALIAIYGLLWVVDFKGINSWGWDYVFRNQAPHPAHVLQLIAYCKARRVRRGMLLYDNKDKNHTAIFAINFTKTQWREVDEWCSNVLKKLEHEQLPSMSLDCQSGNFLFNKCPFSYLCYSDKITPNKIRDRMYRDFTSIEDAWEKGKLLTKASK